MNTGMSSHVVFLTRIGKEVWLCASLDASIEERQTMLGNNSVVVLACDNLELSFQVLCL
jgi:hypothetical protein